MATENIKIESLLENAIPMVSKIYNLHIRVLAKDELVYNWLEDTEYQGKAGEIVLKGTKGEEWIIPEKKLAKYEYTNGSPITYKSLTAEYQPIKTVESDAVTWLIQIPKDIKGEVVTERGDVLNVNRDFNRKGQKVPHADGDSVAVADDGGKPNLDWGPWVVNGEVVKNTYSPKSAK